MAKAVGATMPAAFRVSGQRDARQPVTRRPAVAGVT
jgi:hypothetical protein